MIFQDERELQWLIQKYEDYLTNRDKVITDHERNRIAEEMLKSQNFDNFLATKFSNVKRYGGEGAEAMMAFFVELLDNANSKCNCFFVRCTFQPQSFWAFLGGFISWRDTSKFFVIHFRAFA